jgi:DNA polymerase V
MGFPTAADDLVEQSLDLNEMIVKQPSATYFMKVDTYGMSRIGIHPGDIVVVNRSLKPSSGSIVVASLYGELVLNKYIGKSGRKWLVSEGNDVDMKRVDNIDSFEIWGVVTHCIKEFNKKDVK